MLGSGRIRFGFGWIGKPPLYWSALAMILLGTALASIRSDFLISHIATRLPDVVHSCLMKGSSGGYYLRPWASWFLEYSERISGGLVILLCLIMFLKRDQVRRVR
jgi:hypothetical protein